MNKTHVELIIFLIAAVIKYGVPTVQKFIKYLDKDVITKEDLIALFIEKSPEDFFK